MKIFGRKNKTEIENFGSVLRLIEGRSLKHADGKYKRTYQVKNDATGEAMLECDICERGIYSELLVTDNKKQIWKIKPNRKIMPLRWYVYSPKRQKISEVRLPGFFRMMNPFARTYLKIKDLQTNRKLMFIDLESGFFDFIFSSSPSVWTITENKKVIAKVNYLAKEDEEVQDQPQKRGFFSKLKKWLKGSDWSLQSYSTEPVMNAQTFLALSLVYMEVSSGFSE